MKREREGNMTAIIPGTRVNGFEVLSVNPAGKGVCVSCPCRAVHIFSVRWFFRMALPSGRAGR